MEQDKATAVVMTTAAPDRATAEAIALRLLETRLAACVQLAPIASRYRWKGGIEASDEWLCTIKTRAALAAAVERAVRGIHPYEVPEILVTAAIGGGTDYLAWIVSETASTPSTATSSEP